MHLVLVDGSSFIFRAFHALPQLTRKTDGMPVGSVIGFCNMLYKLIVDLEAEGVEAPTSSSSRSKRWRRATHSTA